MEIGFNQQNPSFLKTMHQSGHCTMISLQDAWNTKCLDFRVWICRGVFKKKGHSSLIFAYLLYLVVDLLGISLVVCFLGLGFHLGEITAGHKVPPSFCTTAPC